ncbi:MAG: oxidoreductase, partial [Cellulomonadaceae bacterium]
LELVGEPLRVIEIAPGMVHTPEFSLNRFGGDSAKADAVYSGVPGPLVAEDVAGAIVWTLEQPAHVNVDTLIVRPRAQGSYTKLFRTAAG